MSAAPDALNHSLWSYREASADIYGQKHMFICTDISMQICEKANLLANKFYCAERGKQIAGETF